MTSQQEGGQPDPFRAMSEHLRVLAEAFMWTLRQDFGDQSEAATDLRDTSYDAQWGRPLFQYVHRTAPLASSVYDHLLAACALVVADKVVQAPVTVTRTAMEALSMMHWLYEPDISQAEKARRHVNLRLGRVCLRFGRLSLIVDPCCVQIDQ